MNPFGLQLRYFRKERGISLKVLAQKICISDKTLSAIEIGRRRPLSGEQLQVACQSLGLNLEESAALEKAALDSSSYIRIPQQAAPRHYRLVHRLIRSLVGLSENQIAVIDTALNHNAMHKFTETAK